MIFLISKTYYFKNETYFNRIILLLKSQYWSLQSQKFIFLVFQGINGTFKLLPHSTGRSTYMPITPDNRTECPNLADDTRQKPKMCESQSSVEELISLDDLEGEFKKSTNKTILSEQQKYADENLFLRYNSIFKHQNSIF